MLANYLIPLIFQYIFEETAFTFTSVVFLGKELKWKKIVTIGVVVGTIIFLVRNLPINFGYHTIISFILWTILLKNAFKANLIDCFIAVFKSFFLLIIIELITINSILFIFDLKLNNVLDAPLLKTIVVLPQNILMFLTGLLVMNYMNKRKNREVKVKDVREGSSYNK